MLAERSEAWITRALGRCVTAGWIVFSGDQHPVLRLSPDGDAVTRGRQSARWLPPGEAGAPSRSASGSRRRATPSADDPALDAAAQSAFDALRAARLDIAQREGVPAYVVAHDRTLREIARLRPDSLAAMEAVPGLGPAKIARYGEALLDALADA